MAPVLVVQMLNPAEQASGDIRNAGLRVLFLPLDLSTNKYSMIMLITHRK